MVTPPPRLTSALTNTSRSRSHLVPHGTRVRYSFFIEDAVFCERHTAQVVFEWRCHCLCWSDLNLSLPPFWHRYHLCVQRKVAPIDLAPLPKRFQQVSVNIFPYSCFLQSRQQPPASRIVTPKPLLRQVLPSATTAKDIEDTFQNIFERFWWSASFCASRWQRFLDFFD